MNLFRIIWDLFFAFKILIVDHPEEGAQAIRVFRKNKTIKFKNHFTGEYSLVVANDSYLIQSFLNCFMGILQTIQKNHMECPGRKEGKCMLYDISSDLLNVIVVASQKHVITPNGEIMKVKDISQKSEIPISSNEPSKENTEENKA